MTPSNLHWGPDTRQARAVRKHRLAIREALPERRHKSLPRFLKWLAVCVPPSKEFVAEAVLSKMGMTVFLPVEMKSRRLNRFSKKRRMQPFAKVTSYIFVGYSAEDDNPPWQELFRFRIVQGILGVLGQDGEYHPKFITDDEMRVMLGDLKRVIRTNPRKSFGIGDLVRITSGPFADHKVTVEDIRGQKAHILLTVLGSSRNIEIGVAQLEAA